MVMMCLGVEFCDIFRQLNTFDSAESSSAGEFHPHALTDPDVTVSRHPALIVQPTVCCPFSSAQTALVAVKQYYSASALLWFYGT